MRPQPVNDTPANGTVPVPIAEDLALPSEPATLGERLDQIEGLLRQLVAGASAAASRWLTIAEGAEYARLSEESIRRLLASRKLTPHYPRPGRILIDKRELDGLIAGSIRRPVGGRGRGSQTSE
jgi:hypothetical protein